MRVVLDTNVLISALISSAGPPGQLLSAVKRGDLALVTSGYQLVELREVLGREKLRPYIRQEEARDLIDNLETIGSLIHELPECELSPDPADNPILSTAIAGKADLIVSGDKADMLALGHVDDIEIVTPARALARLNMFYIGIDLAWAENTNRKKNESGIVMLDPAGRVVEAGWTIGVDETIRWLDSHAPKDSLLFIDAPLVINNHNGQRLCEKEVGQRYWRWNVSANSTNLQRSDLAGKLLLERLLSQGWKYEDGVNGPPSYPGKFVSECYPYTTIVGAHELRYEHERPRYKRKPKNMSQADFRTLRKLECDELIRRVHSLKDASPSMDLTTHPETRRLVTEESPLHNDEDYKHREDLLDATICAWTAALWNRFGKARCQVLGREDRIVEGKRATMIAVARPEQRP